MKYKSSTAIAMIMGLMPAMSLADTTYMVGMAFNFGKGQSVSPGVTMKVLSDNQANKIVGALGASYFFDQGGYFGVDAGVAYLFEEDIAAALTYDFINERPQISVGYADVC